MKAILKLKLVITGRPRFGRFDFRWIWEVNQEFPTKDFFFTEGCFASTWITTMAAQILAVRRLLKDLQEVKACPLVNVVGEPEEGNLFVWHVNIRSSEDDEMVEASNPFSGAVFHLILQFPSSFPTDGPTVYLCTPLPHPNVALQQPSQVIWSVLILFDHMQFNSLSIPLHPYAW